MLAVVKRSRACFNYDIYLYIFQEIELEEDQKISTILKRSLLESDERKEVLRLEWLTSNCTHKRKLLISRKKKEKRKNSKMMRKYNIFK